MNKAYATTTIESGRLVVGEHVTMSGTLKVRRGVRCVATSSGVFDGVRASEWDGTLYVYFRDGEINGHPQSLFGYPADRLARA